MNQSLRDGFFGEDELSVHIGSNITLNTIAIVIGNTVSLIANDSAGSGGSGGSGGAAGKAVALNSRSITCFYLINCLYGIGYVLNSSFTNSHT